MSLIRYNPWSLFDQLSRELESPLRTPLRAYDKDEEGNVATASWSPSVDITESKDNFTLLADIPGVKPEDIEVTMDNSVLTVKGERKAEERTGDGDYRRVERQYGMFYRRFTLPETANADKIEAHSENGVLKITIPKQEVAQAKRINIKH
jgi:HSP20 family protein